MNDLAHEGLALAPAPRDGFVPAFTVERIVAMRRPAADLVHFETTRPARFAFTPGHYARLGLGGDDRVVWRPYSIASPADLEHLAFQVTRVPGGAFTAIFDTLREGDAIRLDRRSFGFLTLAQIAPGGVLWLVSTGTGVAPFLSIAADPRTWERHDGVVLLHSVRRGGELATREADAAMARFDPAIRARLRFIPIVTRERVEGALHARIGELLRSGALEATAGSRLEAAASRVMLCGNPGMIKEVRALARERGFEPGRRGVPGGIATEGYW